MPEIRMTLRIIALIIGLIACLPLHYLWKLAGRTSPWPRLFLGWTARCAGAQVIVEGQPLHRDVLFLANHLSWLDILVVASASGASFVSKDEVTSVFERMAIVGAVTGLARSLGMGPVAEGVEVSDQLEGVTTVGCEEMQGFYFSHPVPSFEVENAVAQCVSKLSVKTKPGFRAS